ncbi:MAG: PepSY-associated TM helix domain-containing protein [Sphingobium sp.]|uniref:PepSY-associated TM helix domain-containing protein n=1 Tax=Sphingobium sp. TaxID=1912891 RepID=UPI0029AD6634|nr:PepSY-associated TM helix domain-containing protein [Sphingobium sp.]MDX3911619.1 PepSY-associated TM helix domain-containing protein [Sphingobium sp.]
MVQFAMDGRVLQLRKPGESNVPASRTEQVLSGLHMAEFGGTAVRSLYFLCGLAGTAMMGSGAILFMIKRRQKALDEFEARTAQVYRVIEGLNVGCVAGGAVACIGYFWANRLIPVDLVHRADWEVRTFFAIWLTALVHAFVRTPMRAWIEQLGTLAILCLFLPVINLLTTGDHLFAEIARGDRESAGVELVAIIFGLGAAWTTCLVRRRVSQARCRPHEASRNASAGE